MNLVSDNLFDRLPDDIVLSIFSKLEDAKSLCISLSVYKRFRFIIPEIDQIFLTIPRKRTLVIRDRETPTSFFKNLVFRFLIKPIQFISQRIKFEKCKDDDDDDEDCCSYYPPNEVLKSFEEIRVLHLRLPCHGSEKLDSKAVKNSNSIFLKWKAEFGTQLHNCVILGSKSWIEKRENGESLRESFVIDDHELKLRIAWTISCLMAASARHYLIQEIVKEREMIEEIEVTDESEQGKLCMNKEQIEEMRNLKTKDSFFKYRSRVPALRMKMWYLENLELPESGEVLEGATLVVVRPVRGGGDEIDGENGGDLVAEAFDGAEEVVVKKLMEAKKCYTLEMNSF